MVKQIPSTDLVQKALKNHQSYYSWLCQESGISGPLAHLFFETEFRWPNGMENDENRAKDAMALREQYAIFVLIGNDDDVVLTEQWHDIDRIKKSILGPACVFEVFVCLARDLNDMLNLDEQSRVADYFQILIKNGEFDFYDDEDYDANAKMVETYWKKCLDRILDRTYGPEGKGGLFPIDQKKCKHPEDQRTKSLWQQMNDWVDIEIEGIY